MKNSFLLALLAMGITGAASATAIVYGAGSNNSLYTIVPTTGATTLVGSMGVTMTDIAEYNGTLYGISDADLYSINTSTGAATEIGATGQTLNALTFSSTGILYAAGLNTTDMYTLNLTSGAATKVAGETTQAAYNASGDLEFISGVLYMLVGGQNPGDASSLVTVNLTTGALTTVGAIKVGSTPVDDVFGLALYNGTLYGFTSDGNPGEVISINPSTAAATDVASFGGTGRGAFTFYGTTDNEDPPTTPEPATLGAMGLGLLALGVGYRKRKSRTV